MAESGLMAPLKYLLLSLFTLTFPVCPFPSLCLSLSLPSPSLSPPPPLYSQYLFTRAVTSSYTHMLPGLPPSLSLLSFPSPSLPLFPSMRHQENEEEKEGVEEAEESGASI